MGGGDLGEIAQASETGGEICKMDERLKWMNMGEYG